MKIFGIGHNYKKHIEELGAAYPDSPTVFTKQDTSLLKNNEDFYLPSFSQNVHHELELVVKISKVGKNIDPEFAHLYYQEVALGIDFTARDLQNELKNKGLPWDLAKGFDNSAPVSEFVPLKDLGDIQNLDIKLDINGETKQVGNTSDMIFEVNYLVSYLSKFFTLKTGDLIFTGTPEGVSKVSIGDHLMGYLNGKKILDFKVK
jgi:2-keto-4-pentenoate hydratase/2-oxohepta-3-ene-1,7-dioic acid hydratase in catechol pathway